MRSRVNRRSCELKFAGIEDMNASCGEKCARLFKVCVGTAKIAADIAAAPHQFNSGAVHFKISYALHYSALSSGFEPGMTSLASCLDYSY